MLPGFKGLEKSQWQQFPENQNKEQKKIKWDC